MRARTPCLDENVLGALFDGRLPRHEVDEVDVHVAECLDCRELVCGLARGQTMSPATSPLLDDANIHRLLTVLASEKQIGRVLDGWQIDAMIGMGGMAEVYAATHRSTGQRAAIKVLRRELASTPHAIERFAREGLVARRIAHRGTVALIGDGKLEDGRPFMVLELLDGRTVAAERLSLDMILWVASEVLDVLAVAHDLGIIHRDVKPDNILITRQSSSVKLLDFGVARVPELSDDRALTKQGMMLGTLAYMPPEQARGRVNEIDARTDLWAVGATMFALLAGRPVHARPTQLEVRAAAMTEQAPPIGTIVPGLPPAVAAIVDRALAFVREARWQDARSMQAAIHHARGGGR